MSGREENEKKIKEYIENKVNNSYNIIKDYSCYFSDKTLKTKMVYIGYVIEYIDYIGESNIFNVKRKDINKYIEHISEYKKNGEIKKASHSIKNAKLSAINHFYDFLISEEQMDYNPCAGVKILKDRDEKEIIFMTPEEIKEVKDYIYYDDSMWKYRDVLIFSLGCSTGLRVTALQEIDIQDIDFNEQSITVIEKGRKKRKVFFGDNVRKEMETWIHYRRKILRGEKENALFISNRKTRISVRTINRIVNKYTSILDKKITPHKMRSSCATNLYEQTNDIYLVQEVLGHKNISNTQKYAQVSNKQKAKAASILDSLV